MPPRPQQLRPTHPLRAGAGRLSVEHPARSREVGAFESRPEPGSVAQSHLPFCTPRPQYVATARGGTRCPIWCSTRGVPPRSRRAPDARVDERTRSTARTSTAARSSACFVEDTTARRRRRDRDRSSAADRRLHRTRSTSSSRSSSPELRENALFKVEHAARRARTASATASPRRQSSRRGAAADTTNRKEVRHVLSEAPRHATRAAAGAAAGPGSNTPAASPGPVDVWTRLRRFLVLGSEGGSYYASEWTLTRENAQAVEQCVARGRRARGRGDRARQRRGPRAEERSGAVRAGARGRPRRRGDAEGGARRAAAGRAARARTCSSSRCSSRASAAGAARCGARSAAGTPPSRSDALAYQA